jgi:UDP-N-acetylmuramoyl-L-alanyl-D-glutamate--2,6-diaminopimelate ligase
MMSVLKQKTGMTLSKLLQGIALLSPDAERVMGKLVLDSRRVQPGDVFLACIGQTNDGRHYIEQAITQGAVAILWDSDRTTVPIPLSWRNSPAGQRIPCVAISNLTQQVGVLADRYYQSPSKSMYMVGVTGTNGKTSTTQFIAQALNQITRCGVIGTLGWGYPKQLHATQHTTPDGITTQAWLANMRDEGAKVVAMEVSSHALDQQRINGVSLDCAVFTNLTHDHLDYHQDMASYAQAKEKLFLWPTLQHAVINIDDAHGARLQRLIADKVKVLSYGMSNQEQKPDIFASKIQCHAAGMRCHVTTPFGEGELSLPLYGRFNISNILATLGVLLHYQIRLSNALSYLSQVSPVAGRMQMVTSSRHAAIVIDYAHTPDALAQALDGLREHVRGQLWCVFGCGGNRDQTKRPIMGAIAQAKADHVIVTSDNPRHEAPMDIIQQILAGMPAPAGVTIEADRGLAIRYVLANARNNDIVLIAGKGHESYQQIGETKLSFNDAEVVKRYLHEVGEHAE